MRAFATALLSAGVLGAFTMKNIEEVGSADIKYVNTEPKAWEQNFGKVAIKTFWEKRPGGEDTGTDFGYSLKFTVTDEFQALNKPLFTLFMEDKTSPESVQNTTFQLQCIKNAKLFAFKSEDWCDVWNINHKGDTFAKYTAKPDNELRYQPKKPASNPKVESPFLFLENDDKKTAALQRDKVNKGTEMEWNPNNSVLTYATDDKGAKTMTDVDFIMTGALASLKGLDPKTVAEGKGVVSMAWQFLPAGESGNVRGTGKLADTNKNKASVFGAPSDMKWSIGDAAKAELKKKEDCEADDKKKWDSANSKCVDKGTSGDGTKKDNSVYMSVGAAAFAAVAALAY